MKRHTHLSIWTVLVILICLGYVLHILLLRANRDIDDVSAKTAAIEQRIDDLDWKLQTKVTRSEVAEWQEDVGELRDSVESWRQTWRGLFDPAQIWYTKGAGK